MAKFVLAGTRVFAGGADLTTRANKVELSSEREDKETTAFTTDGSTWKEFIGGLASTEVNGEGQWEAGDLSMVDDSTFASLGATGSISICPSTGTTAGDLAYLTKPMTSQYDLGGAVGDVAPWQAVWMGAWPLVRGVVGHPLAARTATGNGTGLQLTSVGTGQFVYANLHVVSVSGTSPTLQVTIRSSVDNTFSSPTTRATFTTTGVRGGEAIRAAGPITDTWWKVNWTIGGTTPSFLFFVTLGIA